jgi:elongation factor G
VTTNSSSIHTAVLVGHGGAGKTTLAEALLYASGAIDRKGRVEDGTAVCDYEPEETKRHISLSLAMAPVSFGGHKINFIDTPGFSDFVPEVELALSAADIAIIVVSAVDGVQVQTEVVWRLAAKAGIPRVFFINKLDHERADYEATLAAIQTTFGSGIAPLELPIGTGTNLRGIADLLNDSAIFYDGGKEATGPIPEEIAELERLGRDGLVEGIVVADDALMERYLDGDTPSAEELEATLAAGISIGAVFPVLCGSALSGIGVERLAAFINEIASARPIPTANDDGVIAIDADAPVVARVFKTIVDPFVGKISLLKMLAGTLRPDSVLTNQRTRAAEKLHTLETLRGKTATPVSQAIAGDVVAVPKLNDVRVGDILCAPNAPVPQTIIISTEPLLTIAIHPKSRGDDDKLMIGLHRLQDEDPALVVGRDDETHQTVLSGQGETHLQVACERLQRKYGVEVEFEELKIPYRETITTATHAEGRHKKQTGGHGQFAVAHLRLEPLERGQGFQFVDEVVGGAIPRQFIPAVEKGVERAMRQGGVFGYPVVDVKVICDDGKFHPVDSSEASFEQAGALAFSEALRNANPVPLEPISRLEVIVPQRYLGDVLGDINARRARVLSSEASDDGEQVIVALVPTSELARYSVDLRSLSAGHGRFKATPDHYEAMPSHLVDKMAMAKA